MLCSRSSDQAVRQKKRGGVQIPPSSAFCSVQTPGLDDTHPQRGGQHTLRSTDSNANLT